MRARWEVDDFYGQTNAGVDVPGNQRYAHTTLHHVWVRLVGDGIFLDGHSEGPYLRDVPPPPPQDALQTVREPSLDVATVERMARPEDVPREVQSLLLSERPQETACFLCLGTGMRSVAIRSAYGPEAEGAAPAMPGACIPKPPPPSAAGGGGGEDGERKSSAAEVTAASAPALPPPVPPALFRDASADSQVTVGEAAAGGDGGGGGGYAGGAPESKEEKGVPLSAGHWDCPLCTVENVGSGSKCILCGAARPMEGDAPPTTAERRVARVRRRHKEQCWVCAGTGRTTKMLGSLDYEAAKRSASGGAGESKGADAAADDDDDDLCAICFDAPPKYGISTDCAHFLCADCISDHLKEVLRTGKTPAFCPCCEGEAPPGVTPEGGRITGKAIAFLYRHGVVDKEFMFRFMKLQRASEQLWFECPAKCGNFLIDKDPTLIVRGGELVVHVQKCPCGKAVCLQCHQLVPDEEMRSHRCPDGRRGILETDEASTQLMSRIGKRCPNCSMFIEKNSGCDYMMCGTRAHGRLDDAIRNGGCGHCFMWSSLKPVRTSYTGLDGTSKSGQPTDDDADAIIAFKRKIGHIVGPGLDKPPEPGTSVAPEQPPGLPGVQQRAAAGGAGGAAADGDDPYQGCECSRRLLRAFLFSRRLTPSHLPLPPAGYRYTDHASGKTYYANPRSGKSTWTWPPPPQDF